MATTYPKLHRMALDMLSIPAMPSECERLFSATKVTITDRRNRMGIELVEAHECLKYWLKPSGHKVTDSDDLRDSGWS